MDRVNKGDIDNFKDFSKGCIQIAVGFKFPLLMYLFLSSSSSRKERVS